MSTKSKPMRIRISKPKPCPCCNESRAFDIPSNYEAFGIRVGVDSVDTVCVCCHTCGLRMIRGLPTRWPKGVWLPDKPYAVNRRRLQRFTTANAVVAWNRRV